MSLLLLSVLHVYVRAGDLERSPQDVCQHILECVSLPILCTLN